MNRRTALVGALKFVLSAALVFLVLQAVDPGAVLGVLRKADPWLVAIWIGMLVPIVALSAWRWAVLAPGLSLSNAMKYTWIGVFYGTVLPGAISGDIAKGVSLALRDASARKGLAASIVAEKLVGLATLLLFFDGACAVVFVFFRDASPQTSRLATLAFVLSACAVVAAMAAGRYLLRRNPGKEGGESSLAGRLLAAFAFYRDRPGRIALAVGISAAIHVLNIIGTYVSFLALQLEANVLFAAVVYPVVSVILLVPISVSGIGVRDVTLASLFGLFGFPAASGVALSWLSVLAQVPVAIVGASVQIWEIYRRR